VDNNIVSGNPVDWGGNAVLVTSLERVDNAEDLGSVAASRGWVRHDQADSFLWVDDEYGADGECNALGIDIGSILVVEPGFSQPNSMRLSEGGLTCQRHMRSYDPCLR
jgi:hypothetical protein